MCANCGCGKPEDAHGDDRNILWSDIVVAAKAAGTSPANAVRNIVEMAKDQNADPSRLERFDRPDFAAGWELGSPLPPLRVTAEALTESGIQRTHDEDTFVVDLEEPSIAAVAEGNASRLALTSIVRSFRSAQGETENDRLVAALRQANGIVHEEGTKKQLDGFTASLVAVHITPSGNTCVAYVGDAHAYRVHAGKVTHLTKSRSSDKRVGSAASLTVDLAVTISKPDDVILLCNENLAKRLGEAKLEEILKSDEDLDDLAQDLFDAAKKAGGEAKLTGVVLRAIRSHGVSVGKLRIAK